MKEDIDLDRMYKLSEIVANEWIVNTVNKPDWFYVRKLVLSGKLKASNRGFGKKLPLYMVYGRDIIKYLNSI